MQSPQGDGNSMAYTSSVMESTYLRNAVPARGRKQLNRWFYRHSCNRFEKCSPRKGTETITGRTVSGMDSLFEKCSPRKGTETSNRTLSMFSRLQFEKCSPRKGTETRICFTGRWNIWIIWEMQSPQGDGNVECLGGKNSEAYHLRNAVPARGRKLVEIIYFLVEFYIIWEMQSPQGDGNSSLSFIRIV